MNDCSTSSDTIEALIGAEAWAAMCRRWGGARIYIPQQVDSAHALPLVIGWGAAERLAAAFGGERVELPTADAGSRRLEALRSEVRRLRGCGATTGEIAQALGYSQRQVRRLLNEDRAAA